MLQPEIKKRLVLVGVVAVVLILGIVQLFMTIRIEGAGDKLRSFWGGWRDGAQEWEKTKAESNNATK